VRTPQGTISNILEENVVQPLLVSTSAVQLSSETVRMLLKIDDIVRAVLRRATPQAPVSAALTPPVPPMHATHARPRRTHARGPQVAVL
jgi:hypothetical protein